MREGIEKGREGKGGENGREGGEEKGREGDERRQCSATFYFTVITTRWSVCYIK